MGDDQARKRLRDFMQRTQAGPAAYDAMQDLDDNMRRLRSVEARASRDIAGASVPSKQIRDRTKEIAQQKAANEAERVEREKAIVDTLEAVAGELRALHTASLEESGRSKLMICLTVALIALAAATLVFAIIAAL